jgi:hypothetical protein
VIQRAGKRASRLLVLTVLPEEKAPATEQGQDRDMERQDVAMTVEERLEKIESLLVTLAVR